MSNDTEHGTDGVQRSGTVDRDRMARELAALGEPPPDAIEMDWVASSEAERVDVEVTTIEALFRVGSRGVDHEDLSPLEKRRVWKRLGGRLDEIQRRPPAVTGQGARRAVLTALAMAAGVAFVARLTPLGEAPSSMTSGARSRAAIETLGTQARAGLQALDGPADGARARSLADDYAQRLHAAREGQ